MCDWSLGVGNVTEVQCYSRICDIACRYKLIAIPLKKMNLGEFKVFVEEEMVPTEKMHVHERALIEVPAGFHICTQDLNDSCQVWWSLFVGGFIVTVSPEMYGDPTKLMWMKAGFRAIQNKFRVSLKGLSIVCVLWMQFEW